MQLYIEKLRGRREALGIEDEKPGAGKRKRSGSAGSEEGEGGEAAEEGGDVSVPQLDEEGDDSAAGVRGPVISTAAPPWRRPESLSTCYQPALLGMSK